MATKKLIEVALPLEKINEESGKEKAIRFGHPSTLHLWWARRPLAAARAVIWASLVDDPSSHPELFPSEEEQNRERQRLFRILEQLVIWSNSNNEYVLGEAKKEIEKYNTSGQLSLLDPFAGGGAIPFEAARLGLRAYAHDLNPVAVTLNRSMIEIPSLFSNFSAVNPISRNSRVENDTGYASVGLAEDVEYYGTLLKKKAKERIGHFYPLARLSQKEGDDSNVSAWLWARTIKCPNPACGCQAPLVKSFQVSKPNKKYVQISFPDGIHAEYEVCDGVLKKDSGTVSRKGAVCAKCGAPIEFNYIREESKNGRMKADMMCIIAEGRKTGRLFLSPNIEHKMAAQVDRPDCVLGELAFYPGYINPVAYGFTQIEDLFTDRQLLELVTLSDLIHEIRKEVEKDALNAGLSDSQIGLKDRGKGAKAYAEAITVYLSFVVDKIADYHSSICSWNASKDLIRNTFGLTGMSMSWDYAEANPFSNSSGCLDNMIGWIVYCLKAFPMIESENVVKQFDAQSETGLRDVIVSTDPPYYNNVPYAKFADFFYVWLRRNLKDIYPETFRTMLTPKMEELVADPYRDGDRDTAASNFEKGMLQACKAIYSCSSPDYPVTIYYAFKQSDVEEDNGIAASTGWEKMLTAIIHAGFAITGTWPVRTELANRTRSNGSNALASSIVLVCRKRRSNASSTTRRGFISELKRELKPALQKLQNSNIAPVDLAQSAIGPGMGVFSKYEKVLESDGSPMSVRSALQIINQELDFYFNEQDGELDRDSRFCVELYSQYAFNNMKFGDADTLARAKNTSVAALATAGVVYAQKGVVHLYAREEIPEKVDHHEGCIWLLTQQLTRAMETGGVKSCAEIIAPMFGSNAEKAKDFAYRLYTIAERKGWAQEAYAYNSLVIAWPEIQSKAAELQKIEPEQLSMF